MTRRRIHSAALLLLLVAGLLILLAAAAPAQADESSDAREGSGRGFRRIGSRDILLPITSVEWGTPDRWSFTSRYIHELHDERGAPVQHGIGVTVSPGTAGGRLGAGYHLLIVPDVGEYAFLIECRGVLLRTWGNPLETGPGRTLAGAELRGSLMPFCNVGVGCYWQVSPEGGPSDPIVGMHFGLGM